MRKTQTAVLLVGIILLSCIFNNITTLIMQNLNKFTFFDSVPFRVLSAVIFALIIFVIIKEIRAMVETEKMLFNVSEGEEVHISVKSQETTLRQLIRSAAYAMASWLFFSITSGLFHGGGVYQIVCLVISLVISGLMTLIAVMKYHISLVPMIMEFQDQRAMYVESNDIFKIMK